MKILYAIQGTGNGHITCAKEILPFLKEKAEVDILISGTQVDVDLPYDIKYRFYGLSFIFGKKGGIDYLETYKKSRIKQLFKEISELPVEEYDIVISDFEPVSAWACYLKNKPCVGLSHQVAVVNKNSPKPEKKDLLGMAVLKYYAPVSLRFGFHYLPYDKNIYTPVIRKDIRDLIPSNNHHYTVYLPSFSDKRIIKLLSFFPEVKWEVFSKHSKESYNNGNISIFPISNDQFIKSMVSSEGVLCGAGFQTPAEVLFLGKKLIVIPMKGQYEQQCNAAALKMMGVPVLKNLKTKQYQVVKDWIDTGKKLEVDFPDDTEIIIEELFYKFSHMKIDIKMPKKAIKRPSKFRELVLKKIFYQLSN